MKPESAPSRDPLLPGAWKRALLDGLAVLAAILLAFGIDAWWDSRNDAIRGRERADDPSPPGRP